MFVTRPFDHFSLNIQYFSKCLSSQFATDTAHLNYETGLLIERTWKNYQIFLFIIGYHIQTLVTLLDRIWYEMTVIPLETTRRVLEWICVYPTVVSKRMKMSYAIFSVILFILNLNGMMASAAYLLKFVSTDLESALYALFQVDALTATGYTNIVLLLSRHRFVAIFDSLNEIFAAS